MSSLVDLFKEYVRVPLGIMEKLGGKMISYNFCGGRALRIAFVTLLLFLVFMGEVGAQIATAGDVNITKIGHFGGAIGAVEVSGNYAYMGQGSGLVIVDVSNPAAPTLKGSYDTGGSYGVAVAGNYAYVANGTGLVIVDVSNPAAPTLKSSYDTAGNSVGVAVAGNYAYVADYYGLVIVDVSNPAAPTFKGSYDAGRRLNGVAVAGNYAYVADLNNGLVIFDVSNPAAPTLKASYTTASSYGVAVAGNYAYMADGYNGLEIFRIDISTPPVAGVPVIISWSNTKTNDASLNIAANVSETIRFNAAANQSIDTWNWLLNNVNQNNNFDNFSHHFTAPGNYIIKVNASNANGTSDTVTWNVNVTGVTPPIGAPDITNVSPPNATVTNNADESRTFSITINQTVNVSWLINGTEVFNETAVITSFYTNYSAVLGTWNVTAVASNNNGSDTQTWTWVVRPIMAQGAPEITSFTPASPVNDIVGATRTFTVNVNQTTNVTWYINETEVFNKSNVTQSSYTNTSAALGAWNVAAIVVNANGSDGQTWIWTVTPVPTAGGSISGMKFNDLNGNGTRDPGEPGLVNWTIVLTRPNGSNETAITNLEGTYIFNNLSAGNYIVGEVQQGWKQTAPSTETYNVTLTSVGENVTGKDFGNFPPPPPKLGSISGFKINDTNRNKIWDAGEKGISNWTIRLIGITGKGKNAKVIRKETFTDAMGFYKFDNLSAGRYFVIEKLKKGFVPTSSPVKRIKLAQDGNSINNNFTNRPARSLDRIDGQRDVDDYEVINRDIENYKEKMD